MTIDDMIRRYWYGAAFLIFLNQNPKEREIEKDSRRGGGERFVSRARWRRRTRNESGMPCRGRATESGDWLACARRKARAGRARRPAWCEETPGLFDRSVGRAITGTWDVRTDTRSLHSVKHSGVRFVTRWYTTCRRETRSANNIEDTDDGPAP